jgi:signal transduction histidine kinase
MSKLFGKFHRVQDKQTSEIRGTGLGLWITKQIIEILGGKIFVESIYGTGSSFTFTLPIA